MLKTATSVLSQQSKKDIELMMLMMAPKCPRLNAGQHVVISGPTLIR